MKLRAQPFTFAAQEDERTSKMLAPKNSFARPVVCRYYCDVRAQPSWWLILRLMEDRRILSAIVTETRLQSEAKAEVVHNRPNADRRPLAVRFYRQLIRMRQIERKRP